MDRPSAIYESEKQMKALADVLEGKAYKNTGATNGESKWLKYISEQIEKNGIGGGSSVQPDWNQSDETSDDYIKNKPSLIGKAGTGDHSEIFNDYTNNIASKTYSHAEGFHTNASGEYAHAENMWTTASGGISHAEGYSTKATGQSSHAEGGNTTAGGQNSHAEGSYARAIGLNSHAEGSNTSAISECAHAEGYHTDALSKNQHVQGKYNISDTTATYAHIVGNGSSDTARSNAHTLDWSGNAWYAGTVEGTAMIVKSSTEGSSKRFKITVDDSGVITATEITA